MEKPIFVTWTASAVNKKRATDIDRHVSSRIRRRRIMLGLSQMQLADLLGVTYQQTNKLEKGVNRVTAGRLYRLAYILGVEINYFFSGLDSGAKAQHHVSASMPHDRTLLELARNFTMIKSHDHQDAVCRVARALSNREYEA